MLTERSVTPTPASEGAPRAVSTRLTPLASASCKGPSREACEAGSWIAGTQKSLGDFSMEKYRFKDVHANEMNGCIGCRPTAKALLRHSLLQLLVFGWANFVGRRPLKKS